MQIKLKSLHIENFKGVKDLAVNFSDVTEIFGRNAIGKTTIVDAFMWLLFDKDSLGSAAFQIRPKDKDGNDIDFVEISVTGTLDVDGDALELKKTQKQKWIKKRGEETQTFSGNVNEFTINGFPAKKSEYEAKIASIIDENLFKLLTNPRGFASLKWQDQRKILLEFISEITDEDILATDPEKYEPIADDVLAAGADKTREKAQMLLRELKKEQAEYPTRIDEASRAIVKTEAADVLEKRKADIEAELKAAQSVVKAPVIDFSAIDDINSKLRATRAQMDEVRRSVEAENSQKRIDAHQAVSDALAELVNLKARHDMLASSIEQKRAYVSTQESAIKDLVKEYLEVKSRALAETDSICPTCGQPFPEKKIEEIRDAFEKRKTADLAMIDKRGKAIRATIQADKEKLNEISAELDSLSEALFATKKKYDDLTEAEKHIEQVDYTTTPKYQEQAKKMSELRAELNRVQTANTVEEKDDSASRKVSELTEKLDAVKAQIQAIELNRRAEERVETLKAEQRECGQKVANQEKIVYLLEEYVKAKMDLLSARINSKFKSVRFKLFENQINGGVRETCVMQLASNGSYVDYDSANNASRILGGLDVIKALSGLYKASAPIFLDNSECLDSNNIPEYEGAQLILLSVSDDSELVVENR